jgi:4-diphosphocytidyl-2-C-methyl-D-erythritol kinase
MNSIILDAPAKINIYLDVLGKRKDYYHNISTIFCRLSLSDKITVDIKAKGVSVTCVNNASLSGRKNLAYKAAMLMKKRFKIKPGIGIKIRKNIPVAAGLGGGSSDAAATIMAINRLFNINAPKVLLMEIAKGLGADIGFFLSGYNCAIGRGIGDLLRPVEMASPAYILLLTPAIHIYTKSIYERLTLPLTKPYADVNILARILMRRDWQKKTARYLYNELEDIVLPLYPAVRQGKQAMSVFTENVLLSGSGPTIFGIFNTRKEAMRAKDRLEKGRKWRLFLTTST